MPTLRCHRVSHAYGERTVLRDVDLTLTEPRIGVIGANGSGKSTFARLLNGLVVPTSGSVTVDDVDTRTDGPAVRKRVGFVFSDPSSSVVMPTVSEDIAFSLRRLKLPRSEITARAHDIACQYGLGDHVDHPAYLLSGGQQQMLALAGVLATEPDVIVADEPTTLLDRRNARRIMAALEATSQQVIVVTHQLDLIRDWPRVLLFDAGRVVADGPGADVARTYVELMDAQP